MTQGHRSITYGMGLRKRTCIPKRKFIECNERTAFEMSFTEEGLRGLNAYYRQIKGQPDFIDDILHLNPASSDVQMFARRPELIAWPDDGDILITPNFPWVDCEKLLSDPAQMKNGLNGHELTAWFIHPSQLAETVFADKEYRDAFDKAHSIVTHVPASEIARKANRAKIQQLEEQSGVPYLATTLDLTPRDLPWLKKLQRVAMGHINKIYHVTPEDKVDMFFHNLTGAGTTTLHMHIRINQVLHPHEQDRAFTLDHIIEQLEMGITPRDMLLKRGAIYVGSIGMQKREMFRDIPGIHFKEVDNPHRLLSNDMVPLLERHPAATHVFSL